MAIGSAPEIGTKFTTWGEMSEEARQQWFVYMKSWGPDLQGGYARLVQRQRQGA